MKQKSNTLRLGCIFALVLAFSFESAPDVISYDMKVMMANQDMDQMAIQVAKFCKQGTFRSYVRNSITKSKNTEKILVFNDFLDHAVKQKSMPAGLSELRTFASEAKGRLKASGLNKLEGYNLYFPVPGHRKKWRGEEDILVAYVPFEEREGKDPVLAYSVATGKKVKLDPRRPPAKPVLVLVPEEHETLSSQDNQYRAPKALADKLPSDALRPSKKSTPPSEETASAKSSSSGYLSLGYLTIKRDGEPWYRGDPEIYLMYVLLRNGRRTCYYRDLPGVNKTNQRYWIRTNAEIPRRANDSNEIYIGVWERDGSCANCCGCTEYGNTCSYRQIRLNCSPANCGYQFASYRINRGDDEIHAAHYNLVNRARFNNYFNRFKYMNNWSDSRYAEAWFHWR